MLVNLKSSDGIEFAFVSCPPYSRVVLVICVYLVQLGFTLSSVVVPFKFISVAPVIVTIHLNVYRETESVRSACTEGNLSVENYGG